MLAKKVLAYPEMLCYNERAVYKNETRLNGLQADVYHEIKEVRENCGNVFVTGSTKENIHVEICSKCHSFYTGQQKSSAARGRVDKFNKKYGFASNN